MTRPDRQSVALLAVRGSTRAADVPSASGCSPTGDTSRAEWRPIVLSLCALLTAITLVGWRYLSWGVSTLPGASERPCVVFLLPGQAEDDVPATICDIRRLP